MQVLYSRKFVRVLRSWYGHDDILPTASTQREL